MIQATNNSYILDTRTYHLSTRSSSGVILNPDANYKSFIRYDIPNLLRQDDSIAYVEFSIPYIVIPVSFYQINQTNNVLQVIENGITTNYIFPQGNYNADYFMTKFKAILPSRFKITLDIVNSIFTITNTTNDFTLTANSTIDFVMGFSDTISSSSNTLTLPRCCNFMPLPRICVRCKELGNGLQVADLASNDIILSVPNTSKSNGQIVYRNTEQKTLVQQDILNTMTFSFTDDDNKLLNFNGLSSFFVVQFDIYRKYLERPETFNEIIKNVNTNSVQKIISPSNS